MTHSNYEKKGHFYTNPEFIRNYGDIHKLLECIHSISELLTLLFITVLYSYYYTTS